MSNWKENTEAYLDKAKILYHQKATAIAENKAKLNRLLHQVSEKLDQVSHSPYFQNAKEQIYVLVRMIKAYYHNDYRAFSRKSLVLLVLGLLYFVIPLDIIPDFIMGLGYIDDVTVMLAVYKSIQEDIQDFLDWERTKE
ncbi:YkvA family protein [Echinicola jeungdonensis]|uniref:YkvA family protein n=1 Tax=Echinicola jeungdonensis TaxID=709343 RepID=A0ABV5J2G7_9BACT|nr:YkvA family protein [Echinicola jeungdonensis]MDN3668260.1 YkvA family protein [Echinicola jeungdonensis]